MPLSLYQSSVPVYRSLLAALDGLVDKAVAHAEAGGYPPEVLFAARLYPDMWSFAEQVKAATNHAFRGIARLAGQPIPDIPEAVDTAEAIKARIAATRAFVEGVDATAVDAGADREITFPMGKKTRTLSGREYFFTFSLPNYYFHQTAAYAILRHNGVTLTKTDFLGSA